MLDEEAALLSTMADSVLGVIGQNQFPRISEGARRGKHLLDQNHVTYVRRPALKLEGRSPLVQPVFTHAENRSMPTVYTKTLL